MSYIVFLKFERNGFRRRNKEIQSIVLRNYFIRIVVLKLEGISKFNPPIWALPLPQYPHLVVFQTMLEALQGYETYFLQEPILFVFNSILSYTRLWSLFLYS